MGDRFDFAVSMKGRLKTALMTKLVDELRSHFQGIATQVDN